jgi:A1 cistron-splicing factor AAR2
MQGVKFLPPGFHLFLFSAAANSNEGPETISRGVGVRHGLLRFFGTGETVAEEFDNDNEELFSDREAAKARRRVTGGEVVSTVVGEEHLKGLDPTLAPYPKELKASWVPLVNFVSAASVARVVGIDARGNSRVDAEMGSLDDEKELKSMNGKMTWGKSREQDIDGEPDKSEGARVVVEEDEVEKELLRFMSYDAKRSWPTGAVGEELSRWSTDKSWALSNAVKNQFGGGASRCPVLLRTPLTSFTDVKELLSELQLSFVLFTSLHNFSALSAYTNLLSLLCHSPTLLLPASPHASSLSLLSPTSTLPLYASLLSVLRAELSHLDPGFFETQLPSLSDTILDSLDALRTGLIDASPLWEPITGSSKDVWTTVVKNWKSLSEVAMERFGWELGMVGMRAWEREHKRKRDEGEVDLEDLEEGDDAPVLVEM